MGGGDLNMKKHFHPLTMQNLERVWKAEQRAKEETQKLEQLQRELEEERRRESLQQHAIEQGIIKKKNEKLDWMYAGPHVNHEDYLLGKKIDKNVEVMKEPEDKEVPGANFVMESIADPVKDMAAKIKEDPLFLIRKKEEDSKKELIQNPIKLKKLKEMLNSSVGNEHKSKKSKRRKEKKTKKGHHKRHNSDSDDDENHKKSRNKAKKSQKSHKYASDSEYSEEERPEKKEKQTNGQYSVKERKSHERRGTKRSSDDEHYHKNEKYERANKSRKQSRRNSDNDEDEPLTKRRDSTSYQTQNSKKYGLTYLKNHNGIQRSSQKNGKHTSYHHGRSRHNGSDESRESESYSQSDSENDSRHNALKHDRTRKRRHESKSCSSDSESHVSTKIRTGHIKRQPRQMANNLSKKLKADELEKRRQEMMDNAKWRDGQRKANVKQYKIEDEKEERKTSQHLKKFDRESKAKFIHEMQVKSYSSSSTATVEDRIKRNIYTKQRTQVALNRKFTEK